MKQQRLFAATECEFCAGACFVPVKVADAKFDKRVKRWVAAKYRLLPCIVCNGTGKARPRD